MGNTAVADKWVFGYGSLIWRPALEFEERRQGFIRGFERRFWQASPDHRGTADAPGRVVTLVEAPNAVCWGVAYRIAEHRWESVRDDLDDREKAGYRHLHEDFFERGRTAPIRGVLCYVATPDNPCFVGPSPLAEIAAIVRSAHGPSGSNREYVLRLAAALVEMGAVDEHVQALAALLD